MASLSHTYTRLPGQLRNELGIPKLEYDGVHRSRSGPAKRKELRKAARVQRKNKNAPVKRKTSERILPVSVIPQISRPATEVYKPLKSILKASKKQTTPSPPSSPPPKKARQAKKKLSDEDAEIAALEKALGVKDSTKLPKSFEEDGLGDLLEGLGEDALAPQSSLGKRQRPEGYDWLENKRLKLQAAAELERASSNEEMLSEDSSGEDHQLLEESNGNRIDDESEDEGDVFDGFDEHESMSDEEQDLQTNNGSSRVRENPYMAPSTATTSIAPAKYIPPSLRQSSSAQTEELSRLRKQVQGLLNRMSEANMLSIVGDIEKLYLTNPRQDVSTTILDVLIGLLSDPSTLQDTFLILHAGLIAALYKVVGTEFGAQALQRIDTEFSKHYGINTEPGFVDKRLLNLVTLVADLYNFQVIGSILVYDLIRQFLTELSETNTELILKIIRNAGSQLRQDDPSSLKTILHSLQEQIEEAGEGRVSTKMKFMMEMMNDLKTNRKKTGIAASSITPEHTVRMKKILGTLNQKRVKASEPLRISLKDLRESDKRGKWWLIGSSYKGPGNDKVNEEAASHGEENETGEAADLLQDTNGDLLQLAKEQRMNTSVRQAIFIAIMSATDYNDAYLRLMKLRLKKSQELEIPKVVIHCAKSEDTYNLYYTLLARKLCSDRKLKMAFQFSLWDVFKQLDDENQEFEGDSDDEESTLSLRAIVNLARTFGGLIADGGLGLGVLKNLNLAYLQTNTQTFVEILLTTTILQASKATDEASREEKLVGIFLTPKEIPDMARGLHYFIKKVVDNGGVTSSKHDKEVLQRGCRIVRKALKGVMSRMMYEA